MAAYRWTWRTWHKNINGYYWNLRNGIDNIWKFRRAVWWFRSFDYTGILELMEVAAREMRDCHRYYGHTISASKIDRELTAVAELCRRLREDNYFENAGYNDNWRSMPDFERHRIVEHSGRMAKQDAAYLGHLLKFVQRWWD